MIKPHKLELGDVIGVVAPSDPINDEKKEELRLSKEKLEKEGFRVKFSKNIYSNTNIYSATAKEKAEDINEMFEDKEVKMIWCAAGGNNSNSTFEYLDYEMIRKNPKIFCGFSDITSLNNMIAQKAEIVTFSSTNFKSIYKEEREFSYNEVMKRFLKGSLELGSLNGKNEYKIIKEGIAEGKLIGGNLSLTRGMVTGKYSIDFTDKILFLEELGFEADPVSISNSLYFMKQNNVFNKIKGLWIGNYEHESKIALEKILMDVLENEYNFPIIKSNNFGHIDSQTVIPIGTKARIDTNKNIKVELIESCVC